MTLGGQPEVSRPAPVVNSFPGVHGLNLLAGHPAIPTYTQGKKIGQGDDGDLNTKMAVFTNRLY